MDIGEEVRLLLLAVTFSHQQLLHCRQGQAHHGLCSSEIISVEAHGIHEELLRALTTVGSRWETQQCLGIFATTTLLGQTAWLAQGVHTPHSLIDLR